MPPVRPVRRPRSESNEELDPYAQYEEEKIPQGRRPRPDTEDPHGPYHELEELAEIARLESTEVETHASFLSLDRGLQSLQARRDADGVRKVKDRQTSLIQFLRAGMEEELDRSAALPAGPAHEPLARSAREEHTLAVSSSSGSIPSLMRGNS